ncbi:unnamed protein product, partial [Amoebophrya sp. A25]
DQYYTSNEPRDHAPEDEHLSLLQADRLRQNSYLQSSSREGQMTKSEDALSGHGHGRAAQHIVLTETGEKKRTRIKHGDIWSSIFGSSSSSASSDGSSSSSSSAGATSSSGGSGTAASSISASDHSASSSSTSSGGGIWPWSSSGSSQASSSGSSWLGGSSAATSTSTSSIKKNRILSTKESQMMKEYREEEKREANKQLQRAVERKQRAELHKYSREREQLKKEILEELLQAHREKKKGESMAGEQDKDSSSSKSSEGDPLDALLDAHMNEDENKAGKSSKNTKSKEVGDPS